MICELLTNALNQSIIDAKRISDEQISYIENQLESKPYFKNYFKIIYNDFLLEIENCINAYNADTYLVDCKFIDYNVTRKTITTKDTNNITQIIHMKVMFYEIQINLKMFIDQGTFQHTKCYPINHEY